MSRARGAALRKPSGVPAGGYRPQLSAGPDDARRCCAASTSASRPANWWRWSGRPAPASRRCCTSPACSSVRTGARSISTARPAAPLDDDRAHGDPPHRHRLRLPVPSPAAGVLGAGERDPAADDRRRSRPRTEDAREPRAARPPRSRRPAASPAGSALRRRAAAGGDRPRAGQCAADRAGRRADRQSRPGTPPSEVFDLLVRLARDAGLAAVIATHNPLLAARMDRTVILKDGLVRAA